MAQWFNPNTGAGSTPELAQQVAMAQALRKPAAATAAPGGGIPASTISGLSKLFNPAVTDGGYSVGQGSAYNGTTNAAGMFTPNRAGM